MNYFWLFIISAFSISFPVGATIVRFYRLSKKYFPLAILFYIGLVNEATSYWLIRHHGNNIINSNIYTLVEFWLLLWFFYNLSNHITRRLIYVAIVGLVIWLFDNFFIHTLDKASTVSSVILSFFIVYLSMDKINQLIVNGKRDAYKKTDLLFCLSFFVYYTYQSFIIVYDIFPVGISTEFYTRLWMILTIINIIANVAYTIAILWIPKQEDYTLH